MEKLAQINKLVSLMEDAQKEPEFYLYFGAEDDFENCKRVKFIPKFSAYTLDNMIKVIQSQEAEPFLKLLDEVKKNSKKKELKNEDYFEYIEKHSDVYTKEDCIAWLKDKTNFIDKGKFIESDRVNTQIFKLVLNKFKDFNNETYSPNEIELINSEWNSDFWKKQDRIGVANVANYFRTKNGIGIKLNQLNF
jgi:hypothetical protein